MGSQYNEVSSNENHTGPGAVGNKTPTRDVIIQMIIAIINEWIHPILYRPFNARSHAIPPKTAASKPFPTRK